MQRLCHKNDASTVQYLVLSGKITPIHCPVVVMELGLEGEAERRLHLLYSILVHPVEACSLLILYVLLSLGWRLWILHVHVNYVSLDVVLDRHRRKWLKPCAGEMHIGRAIVAKLGQLLVGMQRD